MKQIQLEGKRVVLEPLQYHHIDQYIQTFSVKVQTILRVKAVASEREYLEQKLVQKGDDLFFYVIKECVNNTFIGAIEIRDPSHRSQLYCWVHENWWGDGYFQEAFALASTHYFNTMKASSLLACVDYENKRSYYALQKVGFILHSILRNQYIFKLYNK